MKNQFNAVLTLALIIALTSLQGCKKDNNSNNPTGQEILTMKVNGVDWVGDDNLSSNTKCQLHIQNQELPLQLQN